MKRFISGITVIFFLSLVMSIPAGSVKIYAESAKSLFINEVMAANKSLIRDGDLEDPESGSKGGAFSDWIEIYNASEQPIDLTGYSISDDSFEWVFPQGIVPANGYLLVWASDKNKVTQDGQLHTNFKISSSGETITLKSPDGTIVDSVKTAKLSDDYSYGRIYDGSPELTVFSKATPGSSNTDGITAVSEPVFSHKSGFYTEEFELKLSTAENNSKIYYTTDGSDPVPGEEGTYEYSNPISIRAEYSANSLLKCSVIKAVTVRTDGIKSKVITHSYFVDTNITDKFDLPVISLVTDPDNLFDPNIGIFHINNFMNKGKEWERPIYVEFFEKDGTFGFSKQCGIRLHGLTSRLIDQKSMRLYADREYDDSKKIEYNIFPGLTDKTGNEITTFKRLILRNSGTDWTRTMFRDALVHSLAADINLDTQAYRPCIVFLNGEYWGLYNIRERYDNIYFSSHYNADKDKIALLEFTVDFSLEGKLEISEGSPEDEESYKKDILYFLMNNDISLDENYNLISTKMDIDNFIDYQIINIFSANTDWPKINVAIWKYKTPDGLYHPEAPYGLDGRWRWVVKDTDYAFGMMDINLVNHDTLSSVSYSKLNPKSNYDQQTCLLGTLLQNSEFRNKFINRFADLLNTVFQPDYINTRIDTMKSAIASSIPDQITRWESIKDWDGKVEVLKYFADNRNSVVIKHIESRFMDFGVNGNYKITLTADNSKGYIRINSIDLKSSTPGVNSPENWTGKYFNNVPVTLKAIPQPGYVFDHWEGISGEIAKSDTITLTSEDDLNITAVFAEKADPTNKPVVTPTPTDSTIVTPTPTPTQDFIYGDVNGDREINVFDYAFLKKYLLGMASADDIDTRAADVDLNGSVDSIDYAYMKQYLLGIIKRLPVDK